MNDNNIGHNTEHVSDIDIKDSPKKRKKLGGNKLLIIIIAASALLVCAIVLAIAILTTDVLGKETGEPYPALDTSLLAETKEDGFDILEYDEYLECNRVVMLKDRDSGSAQSIDDDTYMGQGDGVALVYELVQAIIAGDADAYNSMVTKDVGHYESFTQQQLYDIVITRESQETVQGNNRSYYEYVLTLEFKIRENNGSFKDNLPSDTSRPFTIVVNDSSGKPKVVQISEPIYVKK